MIARRNPPGDVRDPSPREVIVFPQAASPFMFRLPQNLPPHSQSGITVTSVGAVALGRRLGDLAPLLSVNVGSYTTGCIIYK